MSSMNQKTPYANERKKEKRWARLSDIRENAMQKDQDLRDIFFDASRFSSFTTSAYTCVVLTLL